MLYRHGEECNDEAIFRRVLDGLVYFTQYSIYGYTKIASSPAGTRNDGILYRHGEECNDEAIFRRVPDGLVYFPQYSINGYTEIASSPAGTRNDGILYIMGHNPLYD